MSKKTIPQQIAESGAMLAARDSAMQTPDEVRKAFLGRRRSVGPVYVEPFSLGILWLFEEIKHPLNEGREPLLDAKGEPVLDARGQPVPQPLSARDVARAIFIFHDSEGAAEALAEGVQTFDAAAVALVRQIDVQWIVKINEVINQTFSEGLATLPGAGGSNPPETGS
jgi:hypothetical protein